MMTRKNQVDDLLARFERKSITQKNGDGGRLSDGSKQDDNQVSTTSS